MPAKRSIVVIGAGGHAAVVVSTCRAAGHVAATIYDDDPQLWGQSLLGVPILGPVDLVQERTDHGVIVGIGDARTRESVAARIDASWATVIHPHSFVDPTAQIGPGSVVFAGAVVQPNARIGAHAIINTGATVDHDCIVEDYVQVAPGANLCGNVKVRTGTFVGAGAVVLENLTLDEWSVVGGGAVVIRDVPCRVVAVGCPARTIKSAAGV